MKALLAALLLAFSTVTLHADDQFFYSKNFTASGQTLLMPIIGKTSVSVAISGQSFTGSFQVIASMDDTTMTSAVLSMVPQAGTGFQVTITANGVYTGSLAGFKYVKLSCTAMSGSALVGIGQGNGALPSLPINAAGFNFLSFTAIASGVTANAATTRSITWSAGVVTTELRPIFVDINCGGATGVNYIITNSATVPTGYVANAALSGYQPCGQISQVPLEVNPADTPHIHFVANALTGTSAAVGFVTKYRP